MARRHDQRLRQRTFRSILDNVASENAVRLMGRARIANRIAKALRGESRMRAYAVKHETLLSLTRVFPERVRIVNDITTPRFVLVKTATTRFGLHAPAHLFGFGPRIIETTIPRVAARV